MSDTDSETVLFGKNTRTTYSQNNAKKKNAPPTSTRMELFQQSFKAHGKEETHQSLRLVFNVFIPVSEDLRQKILPSYAEWHSKLNSNQALDSAFTAASSMLSNFRFGKSMNHWIKQVPGFGPTLAFNADCNTDSELYQSLNKICLQPVFQVEQSNGSHHDYQLVTDGVGFYHGLKGAEKNTQRVDKKRFAMCDPKSSTTYEKFTKEINWDFKFRVAKRVSNEKVLFSNRSFFHGNYPQVAASMNVHFIPKKPGIEPITSIEDVELEIKQHLQDFRTFLDKSLHHQCWDNPQSYISNKLKLKKHASVVREPQIDSYKTQNIALNQTFTESCPDSKVAAEQDETDSESETDENNHHYGFSGLGQLF